MTTRADLMRETGAGVISATIAFAVAAALHFGGIWIGLPVPAFLNGWASAATFMSVHRWLNGGAS